MVEALQKPADEAGRFYVLLALHRTGSTFVSHALNGHPDIVCGGELFSPDGAKANGIDLDDPVASLDRWLESQGNVPFVGFKLMLDQGPGILEEIARRQFRVIFLTRPNELARHSSQLIARRTGRRYKASLLTRAVARVLKAVSGSYSSQTAQVLFDGANRFATGSTEKVAFDKERFVQMCARRDALIAEAEAILAKHGVEPLRLTYPDVTTAETLSAALRFLGAEDRELVALTKKMNPPDIMDRFSNPNEVRQFLEEIQRPEWTSECAQ